jgi:hypothetical protein
MDIGEYINNLNVDRRYFPSIQTIINLNNIVTQLFQVLSIQTVNDLIRHAHAGYNSLDHFYNYAINHPYEYTPNPVQAWIDAANGVRGPVIIGGDPNDIIHEQFGLFSTSLQIHDVLA